MNENAKQLAGTIDTIITAMAVSDCGLGRDFVGHMFGFRSCMATIRQEMRFHGTAVGDDMPVELVPPKANIVFGPETTSEVADIVEVKRVTAVKRGNMAMLTGVRRASPMCRAVHTKIKTSGQVIIAPPVMFNYTKGGWGPIGEQHYRPTGKMNTRHIGASRWESYVHYESKVENYPAFAAVSEWSTRCCWAIQVSLPQSPSLLMATDPIGVRSWLKMRDVPDGKTRRDALLHWVREHWRQNRKDAEIEHRVREHVRGQSECEWFGLHCRIKPSLIDHAKIETIKQPAPLWRKAGFA